MGRRSYAGGAQQVALTGPVSDVATQLPVTSLVGYPNGSGGPYAVIVDKGEVAEEKMLIATSSGGLMNVATRGYDGTTPRSHSQSATVRLVGTAIDFDEANAHVNATTGVHGLAVNDAVVGVAKTQALANKDIDGDTNTVHDIKLVLQPEIADAITDEADARAAGDGLRYTKAEADAAFRTGAQVSTSIDTAFEAHAAEANPHGQYLTQPEGDALYLLAETASPNVGNLKVGDIPILHSGRKWETTLSAQTVTDASNVKDFADLLADCPFPNNHADKLIHVTLNIKGFTTSGADGDVCRFYVALVCSGGTWLGNGGATNLEQNGRLGGNISINAGGLTLSGYVTPPAGATFRIRAVLEKISGSANVTNSALGGLSAVQMV